MTTKSTTPVSATSGYAPSAPVRAPRRVLHGLGSAAAALLLTTVALPADASVVHEKDSWQNITETSHDFNICGDLATFTFTLRGHTHATDTGSGFHFNMVATGKYTVEFDDPALGTWSARLTENAAFNATPGGVVTLHIGNNSNEGGVRIHELVTLVIGPDGTVRVDRAVAEVVGEAADGAEAIASTLRLRPGLVLLDIALPDIDGFTVADQLAEAGADAPDVVLVSSRSASAYRRRLATTSARGFLSKPDLSGAALRTLLARD